MMKQLFSVLIFLCFLCCSCVNNNDSIIKIKFATWGSASEMDTLKPIISDYEKSHPKIKIELIHIPQDYFQKIHLLLASNLAPDVIFINNLNIPRYYKYLEPINLDKANIFYPQVLNALSHYGKLYAIPRDISNLVIFYNKNLFDLYSVEYPNENMTLENLLLKAQRLTSADTFGISYEENIYYLLPFILTFNESIFPFDNINNLKATNFYKDLVYKYNVAPQKSDIGSKTVAQLFIEQKIAMHISGRWMVPKYKESARFNWGVVTFPGITPCDASGWAISKSSKHKNVAKDFVNFLSSKENIKRITISGLIVPARIDVPFEDKVFIDAIKKSKNIEYPQNYNKIKDKLNDTIFVNNS